MSGTTRRGFLKGMGTTLSAIGITAVNIPPLIGASEAVQGTQAAAAMAIVRQDDRGRTGREDIAPANLEMLVAEQLAWWVGERQSFTAYDITRTLRATYPGVDILHDHVRDVVHARMWPTITTQMYVRAKVRYPSGSAWRYRPLV